MLRVSIEAFGTPRLGQEPAPWSGIDAFARDMQAGPTTSSGTPSAESVPGLHNAGVTSAIAAVAVIGRDTKEKNRVAQRQYRARQRKQRQESSSRIAELSRQLAEAQRKQVTWQCHAAYGGHAMRCCRHKLQGKCRQ